MPTPTSRDGATFTIPLYKSPTSEHFFVALCFENLVANTGHFGPYRFLLDTGAASSVMAQGLAQRLHAQPTGQSHHVSQFGCVRTVYDTNFSDSLVSIGGVGLSASTWFHVGPLTPPGSGVDGIVGADLLSAFDAVRIDYQQRRLTLFRPPGPRYTILEPGQVQTTTTTVMAEPAGLTAGADATAPIVRQASGTAVRLSVPVTIGGRSTNFILDTGAGETAIDSGLAHSVGLHDEGPIVRAVAGYDCPVTVPQLKSGRWSLGSIRLSPDSIGGVRPGAGISGLLGNSTLERLSPITLDLRRSVLVFHAPQG